MKCKHCNSQWNVAADVASKLSTCPFCGKSLVEETKKDLNSIEEVLREITRLQGLDALESGAQITGFFSDLAPKLVRERRLLRVFTDCSGNKIILSARSASANERQKCYEQVVLRMREEYFIADSAARMVCGAFYQAVFGEAAEAAPVRPAVPPTRPPVPPKPVTPPAKAPQEQLNSAGLYRYARLYDRGGMLRGQEVKPDLTKALEYYRKAAQLDHLPSQLRLGEMYAAGAHTIRNGKEAVFWYEKAARQGSREAITALLRLYDDGTEKNDEKYFQWALTLADTGDVYGKLSLARCYKNGRGVEQDYAKARRYLEEAVATPNAGTVADTARQELDSLRAAEQANVFECSGTVLVKYKGTSPVVHVPNGITEIGANAFSNNQSVVRVVLPWSVQRIGMAAFRACHNLCEVSLPESLIHIQGNAFAGCKSLKQIVLPEKLTILGMRAFANCLALTEITIPGGIQQINSYTFYSCTSLRRVNLGEGIRYIGGLAFGCCASLEMVRVPETLLLVDERAFEECASLGQVTAPRAWRLAHPELMSRIVHG